MNDIETARKNLVGHTLSLCKDGCVITSVERGVYPMINLLRTGHDVSGYSAADKVVGKAAAILFVQGGIAEVYADVISEGGLALLKAHGIPVGYGKLVEKIMNRDGTDVCPMEKLVENENDIHTGAIKITDKVIEMRMKNRS